MTNDVSVAGDEFAAEVRNLWKSFGGVPVLKGVSLSLNYGEIPCTCGGQWRWQIYVNESNYRCNPS